MKKLIIEKIDEMDYHSNEAYKSLRTNIQFSGKKIQVICITSCIPNEGKSSVSFNLARSFADCGKKVAFIDCDLRKSVMTGVHRIQDAEFGVSHYLSGQNTYEECMHETNIENLYMMIAGPVPPNPSELLDSEQFAELVKRAREEFDYVIIDTPPLGSVIDSAIVARQVDGAIIVIQADNISYKFAQKVKAQLEKSNCRILGVILNKVAVHNKGYYGKYYGRYYGKYYGKYYGVYGEEYK